MLIFDEDSRTIEIDSINQPILTTHYWVLDMPQLDFMLTPLVSLEQVTCPTLELNIGGFVFPAPAAWNILVYDPDTLQMDIVPIAETAGREFQAFCYGPRRHYPTPVTITATNYFIEYENVGPLVSKQQMLCHPISPDDWICISSSDGYNKFLKDKTVGSLIS